MNKEKAKVKLFERVNITDPEYAQKLYDKEKIKLKIKLVCTIIAAMGSICGVLMFFTEIDKSSFWYDVCGYIWLFGIISALIAGSVINIFKLIFKCGQLGYYIVPFVLLDLIGFVFGLALGLMLVMLIPAIPCLMTLYQSYTNMKDAKVFLDLDNTMNKAQRVVTIANDEEIE